MALPTNADVVVVRGYWWDEATGKGVTAANGSPAVIKFDPVALLGGPSGTPNIRDLPSTGHIKLRQRTATVDPVTGYFSTLLVANNDPDLDAYGGRKVTFPGEAPFLIEVPYNAPTMVVDPATATGTGLTPGSTARAIWLSEATLLETPVGGAPQGFMTSAQVMTAINNGVVSAVSAHDISPSAHTDIRDVIAEAATTAATALSTHVVNLTPHPAYDDQPSLSLLFQNGLV
jgi:hypothetical protein